MDTIEGPRAPAVARTDRGTVHHLHNFKVEVGTSYTTEVVTPAGGRPQAGAGSAAKAAARARLRGRGL